MMSAGNITPVFSRSDMRTPISAKTTPAIRRAGVWMFSHPTILANRALSRIAFWCVELNPHRSAASALRGVLNDLPKTRSLASFDDQTRAGSR